MQTKPSIEPLFPEGTPVVVYDPRGKREFEGFYVHYCKVVTCFDNDDKPENYAHVVMHRVTVDWGFPERWTLTEVTPPHTIREGEGSRGKCEDVGEFSQFVCSECECEMNMIDGVDFTPVLRLHGASAALRYCPMCGRKVVS